MATQNAAPSDRLKIEGNALFAKNNFKAAYKKYTEAIQLDDQNAILYSNRAACSLGMKRYLDASADAKKATDINPGYAKAWARLATASMGLGRPDKAADSWKRALDELPTENLSPADKKQKDQYTSDFEAAKAKFEDMKTNPKQPEGARRISRSEHDKLPWNRATAILPDLAKSLVWDSSAWVIERAYTSWERGLNHLKANPIRRTTVGSAYVGRYGALSDLSNALLEDSRVFHISYPDFLSMYNQQATLEVMMTGAWSDGGAKTVMQEAPKRLKSQGWNSVRPALSVTVRGWVIRAFFEDSLKDNIELALEFYNSAIEVIKWGSELWEDVPNEEKGAIFQPTILRGIRSLRLGALLEACKRNPSRFPEEKLLASADELISELGDVPTVPHVQDVAFFLSFFRYPLGQARAVRGFCLLNKAKRSRAANGGHITVDIYKQYTIAAAEYINAAKCYPLDDEYHAWFLHCAYHAQIEGGSFAKLLLIILGELEESVMKMKDIWGMSSYAAGGRGEVLEGDLKARRGFLRAIGDGEMDLETFVFAPEPGTFEGLDAEILRVRLDA